ncbi:hypothetical protein DFH07DRAFT_746203 [Mycena maculata]|uniref:ferric-chelate reductase (NADPH) n=1 Tax=Mycena maculata TaxID=230809 RepID=A0AAD7IU96_9AGAR|nr:hypothetical protein DFH07DRAFT_746203 [Mycena maculata]
MGGAAADGAVPVNAQTLVYHTVIVMLALVALVFVLRIPRVFPRFWRVSEWTRGHFLGYTPYTGPLPASRVAFARVPGTNTFGYSKEMPMGSSDDSHTTYESRYAPAVRSPPEVGGSYPPHMEPTPSFMRPMVPLLRSRVAPGFSAAQLAVCLGWLGVLLYPGIYKSTGPFVDINRYGYIAASQIPWIFALGAKNNVLGILFGMGYEKLNFLHRFVARLAIISAHLHGLGYIYKWCLADSFMEEIKEPTNYYGLVILLSFDMLLLTSVSYVRKNAYNLFFYSHVVFFHTLVICAFSHYPQLMPYLYAAIAIYAFDKLLRFAKTRISTATIRPIPELGLTRIEFPYINKGWRAGQHVRIQVLSTAMGATGWAQVHPFTIASQSSSQEGLVLMCKKTGTWTHKLFAAAAMGQSERGIGRDVKIVVEGPYGGPGFAMFNSYSACVFVAGGSGITFALSAVQELIQYDIKGESHVRVIELIWVIQDAASLMPLIPQFTAMLAQCAHARLSVSVHYTKATGSLRLNGTLPPGLTLTAGRPRMIPAIESTIDLAVNSGGAQSGMIIGVCGPVGLGDDVSKSAGLVDPGKRDQIGGIEVHEEYVRR